MKGIIGEKATGACEDDDILKIDLEIDIAVEMSKNLKRSMAN